MSIQSFEYRSTSTGLGNISVVVPNSDTYTVQVRISGPTPINGAGQSAIVTLVKVNSNTLYTSATGANGFLTEVPCNAGDTITINTSSINANDAAMNATKINIAISEGSV